MSIFGAGSFSGKKPRALGLPRLFTTSNGFASYPSSPSYEARLGVIYDGKIVALSTLGGGRCLRYIDGAWSVADNAIFVDLPLTLFVSSQSVIFAGMLSNDKVYRSADDGATWSDVLDFRSADADDYMRGITEDGQGNIYLNSYQQGEGIGIYKSADQGVTWVRLLGRETATVDSTTQVSFSGQGLSGNPLAANMQNTAWQVGQRVRAVGANTGDILGSIATAAQGASDFVVTITWDSTALDLGDSTVEFTGGFIGSGVIPKTHTHTVYYDPYRNALLCAYGDGNVEVNDASLQVSADGGLTWSDAIVGGASPTQIVGMVATPDYLFLSADTETDVSIYRSTSLLGGTADDLVNMTYSVVLDDTGADKLVQEGYCWWLYYDDQGTLYAPRGAVTANGYAADLYASTDDGDTWHLLQSTGNSNGVIVKDTFHDAALVSHYHASNNGGFFLGRLDDMDDDNLQIWRVYRSNSDFIVDNVSGDDLSNDGILRPWSTLVNAGIPPGEFQRLTADYTPTEVIGGVGQIVNRDSYSFNGATTAPDRILDAGDTLTDTDSVVWSTSVHASATVSNDATHVVTGSLAWKAVIAGAGQYALLVCSDQISGGAVPESEEDVWLSWWVWKDTAAGAGGSASKLLELNSVGNVDRLYVREDNSGGINLQFLFDGGNETFDAIEGTALTRGQWVQIKMHWNRSTDNPRVRMWFDHALVIDVRGVGTPTVGGGTFDIRVGITVALGAETFWLDDIRANYGSDTDQRSVTVGGIGANLIPNGERA